MKRTKIREYEISCADFRRALAWKVTRVDDPTCFRLATQLLDRAPTIAKLQMADSNAEITPAQERRLERLERECKRIAQKAGCKVRFGDPRGLVVRLVLPDGSELPVPEPE